MRVDMKLLASAALTEAELHIEAAGATGKDVGFAESEYYLAKHAFDDGDYSEALRLAVNAKHFAHDTP